MEIVVGPVRPIEPWPEAHPTTERAGLRTVCRGRAIRQDGRSILVLAPRLTSDHSFEE